MVQLSYRVFRHLNLVTKAQPRSCSITYSSIQLYVDTVSNIRQLSTTRNMSGSGKDQYTSASGVEVPFSEKVADFQAFMKKHGLVMLTTRGPLGALHSRCMAPAETTSDLKMRFIYDRDSYKDKEVENELIPSSL